MLPRITFVGYHSCIRSYKQAMALKQLGYTVNWVCFQPPPQVAYNIFDVVLVYALGDKDSYLKIDKATHFEHFRKTIRFIDQHTDIFHAYNEPDWFVYTIKQVSSKPVVWDLHDLASDRDFVIRDTEALEFKNADAIVVQGPGYLEKASERRPDLAAQNKIVQCLSSVPRPLWPELNMPIIMHGAPKLGGLVYEGGLASGKGGGTEFRYRWWQPFLASLISKNIPVSVHVASNGDYSAYSQAGVRVVPQSNYVSMMQQLTLYDWGLVGNAVHHPAFDAAWPNKLFEYISAGLPVMVHDSKEVGEFVQDNKLGVVVSSVDDVVENYKRAPEFQEHVLRAREKYCMENEVKSLVKLYDQLLKETKR